jgi:hypothetical protein
VIRPVDIWDSAADFWDRHKPRGKTSKVDAIPGVDTGPSNGVSELAAKRAELSGRLAELQLDLGGLVYEMAIRDHFRLDVVVQRAAELQAVDAELGAVERMVAMEETGAAGTCPTCGAIYSRGAVFCWQCGNDLMPRTQVSAPPATATAPPAQSAPAPAPPAPGPRDGQRPAVVPPDPVPPAVPPSEAAPDPEVAPAGTRWPGQD